jgi:hypothetical protein
MLAERRHFKDLMLSQHPVRMVRGSQVNTSFCALSTNFYRIVHFCTILLFHHHLRCFVHGSPTTGHLFDTLEHFFSRHCFHGTRGQLHSFFITYLQHVIPTLHIAETFLNSFFSFHL